MERFPWRIFFRVVSLQAALILLALAVSGLAARHYFKRHYVAQTESQLQDTLSTLSRHVPARVTSGWCREQAKDTKLHFTLTAANGRVLCDSHLDATSTQSSNSKFVTATVSISQPKPLTDVVLRGALPLAHVNEALSVFDTSLGVVFLCVALVLVVVASWSGRALVFGEWSELELSIDDMKKDLASKTESLDLERQELSIIMSAISDAVIAVDRAGVPLFFNSRFEVLFGYLGFARKGARLWEVFRDPDILSAFRTAVNEGKSASAKGVPIDQTGDGSKKYFSLSVAPLRKGVDQIYGAVGIFHDVTDLKSAEQMRIDFVANVSHELRTPLTSIKGYTDTLMDDMQQGRPLERDFIETIARNTHRLMALINDLLDLSSLESTGTLQKTKLSTAEATTKAVSQLAKNFESKRLLVAVDSSAPSVYADPQRLDQVLVNLLDNAQKYTPTNGKIAVVWTEDARHVYLKITDSGPGISLEHHARLFERFYRVDKARSRELGGTGLGLAIVKHIMQRHQGSVSLESRLGHGATFICSFPKHDS